MQEEKGFFVWYKERKAQQEELAILKDYIDNSEDMQMDCTPLPLNLNKGEKNNVV